MSTRRLLIALCFALAGFGLFAPGHSLADDPAAGPGQVQAPAAAKSSLTSVQAPASAAASGAATSVAAAASPAPAAASAPSAAAAAITAGVSGSPPVVIGSVSSQPLSVAAMASPRSRTPVVLMPPRIPAFPALSPANTGAVTAHGDVPVVLAANSLNEVAASGSGTNAPFSAVLGISASRPEAAGAVPATIISSPGSTAAATSPSQTVAQAPAAAAVAPKGPYAVQAPKGPYAAAPKGPYSAQAPATAGYSPAVSAASSAAPAQVSALPQLPNTGNGGLLDRPAPPPQAPGILAGLLLAALLAVAAGLSPSRRAHPAPAVRRTSGQRIYWLNDSLR